MHSSSSSKKKAPQSRGMSSMLRKLAARRVGKVLAVSALFGLGGHSAIGATFNYTGGGAGSAAAPISGNFSNGFSSAVTTSTYTDSLSFAGTTYTATDDLTTQIFANMLVFTNTGTLTLARGGAGTSNSISLGGTAPSINLTNTALVTDALDLNLGANTTIVGTGIGGLAISGVVSGTGFGLTQTGGGTLSLSGANTYSGATTISGGTFNLLGTSGSIQNSSALNISQGGTLLLTNTAAANNTNRIADSLAVNMSGGTFNFNNDATANTFAETVGQLNLQSGLSTITTTAATTGGFSTLTFGSLNRSVGSTVNFSNGTSLGAAAGLNKILFATAPTLDAGNLIGGWTTIGGTDFASYGANGVVVTTYTSHTEPNWVAGDVVNVGGALTMTGNRVIDALKFRINGSSASAAFDLGGFTLRTQSGGVVTSAGSSTSDTIQNGFLTAGTTANASGELLLTGALGSSRPLILTAQITNNGTGVTSVVIANSAGGGVNVGNTANNYTGSTTIALGSITLGASEVIPNVSTLNILTGSTFAMNTFSETIDGLNGGGTITNGAGVSTSTLTIGSNNSGGTFTGNTTTAGTTRNITIIKNGTGTQVFGGTAINAFGSGSFTINGGTLEVSNANTLGNAAVNPITVNAGTLQLDGLTLANTSTLTQNNGGTIKTNGSSTVNKITVGTTNTTDTLATTNAGDILTIGNAANTFTGGQASTMTHVTGPGTLVLSQASNYIGSFSLDGSGTTKLGTATSLGSPTTASVAYGPGSTSRLQLAGNNVTVVGLLTNTTPGSSIVENGAAGTNTLTVNNATANTFAGIIQNGAAGTLALAKGAAGTLSLTGANTYTGNTVVTAGTLLANNASGSATGTGTVGVSGTGILGGTGTISGAVTVGLGAAIAPGSTGIGTLTLGALTLNTGSFLNYDITNASSLDQINVTGTNGLTINGGTLNINGGSTAFTTNGVYNLIGYNGTLTANGTLTLNSGNQNLSTNTYTFGASGSYVTLIIASSGAVADYYNEDADDVWSSSAAWTASVPNTAGAFASFGGGGMAITANRTVTVDGAYTVGTLSFNNPTYSYTLASGTGANLTLDNGASTSFVTDTAGSHTIQAPITMTANGAALTVTGATDTLTVSGPIAGTGAVLTKAGLGTLALTGSNTYSGGTLLNAGTIQINSATSIGDNAGNLTFNGGTLQLLTDVSTARGYIVGGTSDAIINTNGHALNFSGTLTPAGSAAGGLIKNGTGTLTLSGANTYTGGTVITAGTLNINNDAALGAVPGAATTNLTFNPGTGNTATLQAGGNVTLNANRSLVLNSGTAAIDTQANTVTLNGASSGSGTLTKAGSGTLAIASGQGYTGGTVINAGKLNIIYGGSLTNGITLNDGTTFIISAAGNNLVAVGNSITVNGATTFNSTTTGNGYFGALTGDATSAITLSGSAAFNFSGSATKQFANFLGTLSLPTGTSMDDRGTTPANGGDNTTFSINGFVSSKNVGNWYFGALTSTGSTGLLDGTGTTGNLGGTDTYTVGAKGLSTTYGGILSTNAATGLIKVGAGTLTLTGANTYLATTISAGTLQIGNGGTAGTLGTGAITDNAALSFSHSDDITVTNAITGTGSLSQLGTGKLILTGTDSIANLFGRSGTIVIDTGTTVTTSAFSSIGVLAGDTAVLTVQGTGALNANADLNIGDTGSTTVAATGTLNVTGGTVTNNASSGLYIGSGFTAGTLATGTVNQSGGTVTENNTAAGTFVIGGRNSAGGTGIYNLSGGSVTAGSKVYVGGMGTGTLTLSGGTFTDNTGVRIGNAGGAVGTVNLNGGTLSTGLVDTGSGTSSILNFNGGTLQARASSTAFLTGLTTANVRIGGAIIDTNGNNDTISQALLHDASLGATADGGLVKNGIGILSLTGANTYTGGTTINSGTVAINSSSSLGASSGTATINAGTMEVTTDGINSTRNITLGNAASTVQTDAGVTFTANGTVSGSGTLNKTGAGTLVLTAANNYNGGTVVSNGTITAATTGYSTGTIQVNSGATVDYTQGVTTGTVSNTITGTGNVTVGAYTGSPNGNGGTVNFTGVDSVTGSTTVTNGTLQLNNGTGPALTGTGALNVAAGGVAALGSSNQLSTGSGTATPVALLADGTLQANGLSQGSGTKDGTTTPTGAAGTLQIGTGTAAATATINFGDLAGSFSNALAFANSSGLTWNGTLNITGYNSDVDQFYVGNATGGLTPTQLGLISFNGVAGAAQLSNGEVVIAPAPEPSGWVSMLLGGAGLAGVIARKRRKAAGTLAA